VEGPHSQAAEKFRIVRDLEELGSTGLLKNFAVALMLKGRAFSAAP